MKRSKIIPNVCAIYCDIDGIYALNKCECQIRTNIRPIRAEKHWYINQFTILAPSAQARYYDESQHIITSFSYSQN